jgi:WD40 repeat protein
MSRIGYNALIGISILCCLLIGIPVGKGAVMKGSGHNRLNNLFFLPNHSELVGDCNSDPGSLRFWSLEDGSLKRIVQLDENQFSSSMAVSSDGRLIAVGTFKVKRRGITEGWGTSERSLRCYSTRDQRWIWEVKGRDGTEDCAGCDLEVAFSSDNARVLAASAKYIAIYDARTGELLRETKKPLSDYSLSIHSMKKGRVFSPSGKYFVVWQEKPIPGHEIMVGLFANDKMTVWDFEKDKRVAYWKKDKPICSARFPPDERKIILGSMDGYLRVWDMLEQRVVREWKAHSTSNDLASATGTTMISAISQDGLYLASFGDGNTRFDVRVWNYATGALVHEFRETAFMGGCRQYYPITFDRNGGSIAFQNWGNLCLYDTKTWEERWCVPTWPEDNGKMWRYEDRPGEGFVTR